jgi:hypothetical protein
VCLLSGFGWLRIQLTVETRTADCTEAAAHLQRVFASRLVVVFTAEVARVTRHCGSIQESARISLIQSAKNGSIIEISIIGN